MKNYPYDASLEWVPREYPAAQDRRAAQEGIGQPQRYAGHIDYPSAASQQQPRQVQATQQTYTGYRSAAATAPYYAARPASRGAAAGSQKMSKAEALDLLDSLKKTIMIGAIIGFGVLSALVATHAVGSAASQSQSTPGSNSISPDNNNNTNPSNNGGFFNQQGGGNGFGSGGYSQPSSGTGVS
jgi:hypothetical protein